MKFFIGAFLFILLATISPAQSKLPVIQATSKNVSIRDGDLLSKNSWSLSPRAKPDIYTADRTRQIKWVTFYTDKDSIRVKVKPGSSFDFIILLNGKDSCYTRIKSAVPQKSDVIINAQPDTIPFRLTAYNAIAIKAVVNGKDTLNLHFDASSSGIHFLKDVSAQKLRKEKVNTLRIGSMDLKDREISSTNATAQEMDGRIGFDVFEGRQVELNYDKHILVIHSHLPDTKGYVRCRLLFRHGFPCVSGVLKLGRQTYSGLFTLDNGSAAALILDSAWAARFNIGGQFKLMHTSVIRDANGKKYETKIVESPVFGFSKFELTNVPTTIFATHTSFGFEVNFFGNDVLKRFNMILDLQRDYIYFKENNLLKVPYRDVSGS
jgi:hypothetical protein